MERTVILSDGLPCVITVLGLFDLDRTLSEMGPALAGPYVHEVELVDGTIDYEMFDIHAWSKPPEYPGLPKGELRKFSPEYYRLLTYQVYGAAVTYEVVKRLPEVFEYIRRMTKEIINLCVAPYDRKRIVDLEDYMEIFDAAYIPPVTKEHIAESFRINFGAKFGDAEVFEAMAHVRKGSGRYDFVRWCEMEAMGKFGFKREEEWAALPHGERVRKTAQIALPMLMETLAQDKAAKEAEAAAKRSGR